MLDNKAARKGRFIDFGYVFSFLLCSFLLEYGIIIRAELFNWKA